MQFLRLLERTHYVQVPKLMEAIASLSLEVIPGFYGDDIVTGFRLVCAWK